MGNKFLQDVKVDRGVQATPQFVNADIDTKDIVRVGTAGSELLDTAFNTAIKYSKQIENMKATNEIAKIELDMNKELQDYELAWSKKDKFDDSNYTEYKKGLDAIYEKSRVSLADTVFANEKMIKGSENDILQNRANSLFKADGQKAEYDIKKTTDLSIAYAQQMMEKFIDSGDVNLKKKAIGLYNNLTSVGVPAYKVEMMKMKALTSAEKQRFNVVLSGIVNSQMSDEEKLKVLQNIGTNVQDKKNYEVFGEDSAKDGYISKENSTMLGEYAHKSLSNQQQQTVNKYINSIKDKITNENYQRQQAEKKAMEQSHKEWVKKTEDIDSALTNGNTLDALQVSSEEPVTSDMLLNNATLSTKYFGDTPDNILNKGEYIPTMGSYEINQFKNKSNINLQQGIPRIDTLNEFKTSTDGMSDIEKENFTRELVDRGVISNVEANYMNGNIVVGETEKEIINSEYVGYKNFKSNNKINSFSNISYSSDLSRKLRDSGVQGNMSKTTRLSNAITGSIMSGRWGNEVDISKGVSDIAVKELYDSNQDFRHFVDTTINMINANPNKSYRRRVINKKALYEDVNRQYKESNKEVRLKTKERRDTTTPYVEEVGNEYMDVLDI